MNIEILTQFFGWCLAINFAILMFSTAMILVARDKVRGIHSRMFGLSKEKIYQEYFSYLATYKVALIVFNLVPYIALKLLV